jgi:hypothetical protein
MKGTTTPSGTSLGVVGHKTVVVKFGYLERFGWRFSIRRKVPVLNHKQLVVYANTPDVAATAMLKRNGTGEQHIEVIKQFYEIETNFKELQHSASPPWSV